MALKLQKAKGTKSFHGWVPHFYGQYRDGKAIRTCALKTRLRGVPPVSGLLSDPGDADFEAAKAVAEQELDAIIERAKDKNTAIAAGCSLLSQATGQMVGDLPIAKLAAWYRAHRRTPETDSNADWLNWHDKIINDFATWARHRKCNTVFEVTRTLAHEYATILAKSCARGTLKAKVYWLSGAFRAYLPNAMKNPFDNAYTVAAGTLEKDDGKRIFRKPLDNEQLLRLWETARHEGAMWYDIAVCAACTGMRIGDVCNLKWENVDLRNSMLPNVPTAKTGVFVTVPLWDYDETSEAYHPTLGELRRVLDAANTDAAGKDPVFVFPEAHAKYCANPSVISARGKMIFARALFGNETQTETVTEHEMSVEEIKAAIAAAPWNEKKRTRIGQCYSMFAAGSSYPTIRAAMNYPANNRISMDLSEVERVSGAHIRPKAGNANSTRTLLDKTREARTVGARSASVYGWHSLRHSWVVLMMEEGVQYGLITKEDVQAVVGHTTFAQTLEYYNPTEKQRVERMRKGMGRKRRAAALPVPGTANPAAGTVAPVDPFAGLTNDQRAMLANMMKLFATQNAANRNGGVQ